MGSKARLRTQRLGVSFSGVLFRIDGPGGWHFVALPEALTPPVTHAWGRTPVRATVDGQTWDTSVWKDTRSGRTLLAVPARIRGGKVAGAPIDVSIEFRAL
ncbi:MAG: DUF1905 domain-containing protein [Gemmatimonadales bacterium]